MERFKRKDSYNISDLIAIMKILRGENGCPWDKEQTHDSIRQNFLEEAYETVEAIDTGDTGELKEELGDVLLQVVFHAQMEEEAGRFDFDAVADGICKKLIYRHPHIFGDVIAETSEVVLKNWDSLKQQSKGQSTYTETLESIPAALPALMRSQKIGKRAARAGFCYPDTESAMKDLRGELAELEEAVASGDAAHMAEELGDLLFAAVNVARHIDCDAELALLASCDKFIQRFSLAERYARQSGHDMKELGAQALDTLWKRAKSEIRESGK